MASVGMASASDATKRTRQERRGVASEEEEGEHEAYKRIRRKRGDTRGGGVYVPPAKAEALERETSGRSLDEQTEQRKSWERLKRKIHGAVNKVNAANVQTVVVELFRANLLRGRGLLAKSLIQAQTASPAFTQVYAAVVAVVNAKFPSVGETVLHRVVLQFRRAYRRNDKALCLASTKFIAHLVNQHVAHELLVLELLALLLENPTEDSVEVAAGLVKEVGETLAELSPQGLHGVFERFRNILHEGAIGKRTQYIIENLFAVRKANFEGFPAIPPDLDLLEEEDLITHEVSLDDDIDPETAIDLFRADPNFEENEAKYAAILGEILGDEEEEREGVNDAAEGAEAEAEVHGGQVLDTSKTQVIQDETGTDDVNLRRTIYLTIMSSVDFEEAGHKLMKIDIPSGREMELCTMILECCSQERTYLRYYGLLGERFAKLRRVYHTAFAELFGKQYELIHRLETAKLRNVAKFFANLLASDALTWGVLSCIRLTEEETTSSSRIFVKVLFLELAEILGLKQLNERLMEPSMQEDFAGIFPKDTPKNMRFSINFFTSIGLGGITDALREHLKNVPTAPLRAASDTSSDSDTSLSDEGYSSSYDSGEDGRDNRRVRAKAPLYDRHRRSMSRGHSRSPSRYGRSPSPRRRSPTSPRRSAEGLSRDYNRYEGHRRGGEHYSREKRYP
eukprot:scaffold2848_cov352-Pavlova_lutheri.AAC.40